MDKILENLMNFINENTTLLIIICVFLIFVLIGYLIDNSIKTRKMERRLLQDNNDNNINSMESINSAPVVEANEVPSLTPEVNLETPIEQPVVPEVTSVEPPKPEPVKEEQPINNEITVSEKVNDLLLRDFAENGDKTIDVTPVAEEQPVTPEVAPVEENILPINDIIVQEPVKEDSIYKNDKKLSDIFKKTPKPATSETSKPDLEKTIDFNNELDRILQKLNDTSNSATKDSTLDETTDFTNMF